jgi:hypothetical protein
MFDGMLRVRISVKLGIYFGDFGWCFLGLRGYNQMHSLIHGACLLDRRWRLQRDFRSMSLFDVDLILGIQAPFVYHLVTFC